MDNERFVDFVDRVKNAIITYTKFEHPLPLTGQRLWLDEGDIL